MNTYSLKQLIFYLCLNREKFYVCYIGDIRDIDVRDVITKLEENKLIVTSESQYYKESTRKNNLYSSLAVLVNRNANGKIIFEEIDDDRFLKVEEFV